MAVTGWQRTMVTVPWFQKPEPSRPVASTDWEVIATAIATRPTDTPNWHYTVGLTAWVDGDVEGELRVRTSEGDVSLSARIVSHVGPILMGWTQVTDWSADLEISVFLEGRRTQSAGGGGGVGVADAALSFVSLPTTGTAIVYPPGYDPGAEAGYPPDYDAQPYP